MRSGRDIPGGGPDHAAEPPGPATFAPEALRATLVGIGGAMVAAWIVGGALGLASVARPVAVAVYYMVLFGGLVRTALAASTRWGSGNLRADFGWWARRTDALRAVVLTWLAGMAGALAVSPWGETTSNADWIGTADGASAAVFVAFAVVAAPLFEELVFRGLLQRALTGRFGPVPAILVQGAVFGLYHFELFGGADNLPTIIYITTWGTVLGFAAHRYRRLGPGMVAHALTNILVTAALLAG